MSHRSPRAVAVRTPCAASLLVPSALAGALVPVLLAAPAAAHVTVTPTETEAGAYTVLTVALSHGCDGSATTRVAVAIPPEVLSVKAARDPFWTPRVVTERLASPATGAHGDQVTERVGEVVFTARPSLPDGVRDSFELTFQIPEDAVGKTLAFPAIQTCERGATAWTEIPAPGQDADELEHPAPSFVVTAPDDETADPGAREEAATVPGSIVPGEPPAPGASSGADAMGAIGLGAGLLGLVAGVLALARVRRLG